MLTLLAGCAAKSAAAPKGAPHGIHPSLPKTITPPATGQTVEFGKVRLNPTDRTITFPAVINLREGPVEYLVVTDYGKIHESLLRTDIAPHHLQVALLLLLGQPQPASANPGEQPPSNAPALSIDITWKTRWRTRSAAAGTFVQNRNAQATIGSGRWAFVGSRLREDGFAAQLDGSVISLIDDPDVVIANTLPGADDDDNWLAVGRKLPPLDTPVDVVIREIPQDSRGSGNR